MSKPNRCEYPFKACEAVQERDALRASLAAAEAKLADEERHAEAIVKAADDLCSRGLWPDTLLRYETAKSARRAGKAAVEREEGKR